MEEGEETDIEKEVGRRQVNRSRYERVENFTTGVLLSERKFEVIAPSSSYRLLFAI